MERARSALEELEGLERCVSDSLRDRQAASGRLARSREAFRAASLLDACSSLASDASFWTDRGTEAQAEAARITSGGVQAFFAEKRALQDFYVRHPNAAGQGSVLEACRAKAEDGPQWSGEERHGKYLDLHEHFHTFVNLKSNSESQRSKSYSDYLDGLADFDDLDLLRVKTNKMYVEYLRSLRKYLEGFHKRAQALVLLDLQVVKNEFEEAWEKGVVHGWERKRIDTEQARVRLDPKEVVQELLVRGAKSGGSPGQRVERLSLIADCPMHRQDSQPPEDDPAKAKAWKKAKLFDAHEVAYEETLVKFFVDNLAEYVDATKSFITRKQTQTYEELRQEEEAEALRDAGLDDDDDELYEDSKEDEDAHDNPKNLPLDWDGKPIPLWLYKLHGLNMEFTCEICGNYTYRGRHAYDRHFKDWRHAHGMSVLGIPNTAHFHDITKIDEARALYAKLRDSIKQDTFSRDEEQLEDSQGNVLDRKTYLDLKRQGLL
mmetsp:Transcript_16711/g.32461  ORF Transcript_16711/g.32461 Transcript_16711/m.32461 type:complete len:490 (-) Transcript_16711:350-1819(-)